MKLLFSDAHCHSNPVKGLGARIIAKKFRSSGGWFIALVSLPPYHYGIEGFSIDSYMKAYELVIREAKIIREEGLKTKVIVGFHPAEVDEYFRRGWSLEDIISHAQKIIDKITELHKRGLVDGIGEVGRQHYSTAPARFITSELIMWYALEVARDHDMIVHLHLEQGGYSTVKSIKKYLVDHNIPGNKVLLHHATYNEAYWAEKENLWYSIPAKKKLLEKVLEQKPLHVLTESDFIDDPRRPGVSSYPWNITVLLKELLNKGIVDEEYVYKIEVDNIVNFYSVEPP